MAEYRLRSFSPWLASISLDVAMGGDVVQDPSQVIFIISKNPNSTKPTVILNFSMTSLFLLMPTVQSISYISDFIADRFYVTTSLLMSLQFLSVI